MGPTNMDKKIDEIRTPKMHLSIMGVLDPRTLMMYDQLPFLAQYNSMWYWKSYQNWKLSSEVFDQVKSRMHLNSVAKGRPIKT